MQCSCVSVQILLLLDLLLLLVINSSSPRMLEHSLDANAPLDIPIEHLADKVNALFTHNVRHSQVMVHDFVDGVERVFLVDDGVQQDPQGPNILLFAAVGEAAEDFGGGVIYTSHQ